MALRLTPADLLTGLSFRAIHWMALIQSPYSAKTLHAMRVMLEKFIWGQLFSRMFDFIGDMCISQSQIIRPQAVVIS